MAKGNDYIDIHVIGPGYGESIVVQFPDGSVGVIDPYCSKTDLNQNNRAKLHPIIRFLENHIQPEKIRFVLVTHPHADHCLGTSQFLEHFSASIERLWVYDAFHSAQIQRYLFSLKEHSIEEIDDEFEPGQIYEEITNIDDWISKNKSNFLYVSENTGSIPLPIDNIRVDFYAPTSQILRDFHKPVEDIFKDVTTISGNLVIPIEELPTLKNLNHLSVVMKLTWDETKLLFCADAQELTWDQILVEDKPAKEPIDIDSHFVKISHHGSENGYNKSMFPFSSLESLPKGVVTPYNRGVKLPSSIALSELSPNFENIITTCFPSCPNLYNWDPLAKSKDKIHKKDIPMMPGSWLNNISQDERLKDAITLFPKDKDIMESATFPVEWIEDILDQPSLMNLLREPYRTAVDVLVEKSKTYMDENLFRVSYHIDRSGKTNLKSFTRGCAIYKKS